VPPVEGLKDAATTGQPGLRQDGKLLARLAPEERIVVPLSAMSPKLVGAFLAVEDQRFYEHQGIDWRAWPRHLARPQELLAPGRVEHHHHAARAQRLPGQPHARPHAPPQAGGDDRRAPDRAHLQQAADPGDVPEPDYLANGYYGVEAAARGYFGRSAMDLSLPQAAVLAALPKAPSNYDPRRFPDAALKRRNLVLDLMAKHKVITAKEEAGARKTKLRLTPGEEEGGAPWFVASIRRELHDRFGPDAETQGLRVRTTLDRGLQRIAEKELLRQIEAVEAGKLGPFSGEKCNGAPDDCLEGMFVALDTHTGDVRALVGGRDYALSEFDRVTQARRQPGSTFKAFVWAAAIQSGIPVSTLLDPAQLPADYAPADGQLSSDRPLNLREALRISSNRASVALGQRVGLSSVAEMAHACGIGDALIPPYPSSFLGAADVIR